MREHIAYRYEIVKKLGKGSFGIVLKVFDHKNKEFVALKILKNKKRLYKQGLVEAKLIEVLNNADPDDKKNIIRRLD
jgi:serine/threonine protein kinase